MVNKTRYIEKNILCKYDLSEEFFSELGIEVTDVIPLRKIFILTTSEGRKILKLVNSSEAKLKFIDTALEYVSNKYSHVLKYYKNKHGEIYIKWNGETYVLLDMIDGREAGFNNPIEIEMCAKAMANMHEASKYIFDELDSNIIKGNVGAYVPEEFKKSLKDMLDLKAFVEKFKYKNKFDKLFLENVDSSIEYIKRSIELLSVSNYNVLLNDKEKRVLCHNDLAHHNFIIDGENVEIIDFDYCNIDMRIVDITNYIIKVIKNLAYDSEKVEIIFNAYNSISEISSDEVKVLYALMTFPKDFVTIVRDYYYKQKTWEQEVFLSRFNNKLSNEVYRKEFLENFIFRFEKYFY
ncbi:CotS family spore coat protein [Clostridium sp.]|uniref:CotS family spore coat protein n=1 Tax=Clostridium sp. TaxID=1506 RepID=UPI003F3A259A